MSLGWDSSWVMHDTLCSRQDYVIYSFQLVQGSITDALCHRHSPNVRWQSLGVRPRPRLTPFARHVEDNFFFLVIALENVLVVRDIFCLGFLVRYWKDSKSGLLRSARKQTPIDSLGGRIASLSVSNISPEKRKVRIEQKKNQVFPQYFQSVRRKVATARKKRIVNNKPWAFFLPVKPACQTPSSKTRAVCGVICHYWNLHCSKKTNE